MKIGARVVVVKEWSSFYGQRGAVTQLKPYLAVLLDGERLPMRFGEREVVEESTPAHIAGAE